MTPDPATGGRAAAEQALADLARHPGLQRVDTPAVVAVPAAAERNLRAVVLTAGSADRLRCHVKTARSPWAVRMLLAHGVEHLKVSTVQELAALLALGVPDVLWAYPAIGATQRRVRALATAYPRVRVSVLTDSPAAVQDWQGSTAAFIDLDTGMGRTGLPVHNRHGVLALAAELLRRGHDFRGLHVYDGHLADAPADRRAAEITSLAGDLAAVVAELAAQGTPAAELVLAGSHTFADAASVLASTSVPGPAIRWGPGTALFNDDRSLDRFADPRMVPAAGVLSRVVSVRDERITTDAGLTAVQIDAGAPHLRVLGRDDLSVTAVSQELLVLTCGDTARRPTQGDLLVLLPRHLDTAIAQFPTMLTVSGPDPEDVAEHPTFGRWSVLGS